MILFVQDEQVKNMKNLTDNEMEKLYTQEYGEMPPNFDVISSDELEIVKPG